MFFWYYLAFLMISFISGSSAFSKSSLNIWKFMVHVLLKPGLENFEHYFTSVWNECNCAVVWAFFGIAFLWDWNENWPLQSCDYCWVFQMCWHTECSTFTASSFRIWNSSSEIPSPPLALFAVMLPKAIWLHIPGCLYINWQMLVIINAVLLLCIECLLCALSKSSF